MKRERSMPVRYPKTIIVPTTRIVPVSIARRACFYYMPNPNCGNCSWEGPEGEPPRRLTICGLEQRGGKCDRPGGPRVTEASIAIAESKNQR